jgi:hypothetical protein
MINLALIKNGTIQNIIVAKDSSYISVVSPGYDYVKDTSQYSPIPILGDLYNSNTDSFSHPVSSLTQIEQLQNIALDYINFGCNLYTQINQQVWAANQLASSQGNPLSISQVMTLLNESTMLQATLESGSLVSSLQVIAALVSSFPQYNSIGQSAVTQINNFLATNPIS